jgi:hypothetical protein
VAYESAWEEENELRTRGERDVLDCTFIKAPFELMKPAATYEDRFGEGNGWANDAVRVAGQGAGWCQLFEDVTALCAP